MRHDPPSGEELDELIARMTGNVLAAAEPRTPAPSLLPPATATPRKRVRLGAVILAVLVVLGVGTAGGALALGFGTNLFPAATPTPTPSVSETVPPQPTPSPTTTTTPEPPAPTGPSVQASTDTFTAPSWGGGLTADVSGLDPDTTYEVRTDARYRGESKTPDGYFSVFSSPVTVTTDGAGSASVTWTPDVFPENFTDSGESGFMLSTSVRVDPVGGPADDSSGSGHADPLVLSAPLSIAYLPIDRLTIDAEACVEPTDLIGDTGGGLPVTISGLLPGEFGVAIGVKVGGSADVSGFYFDDRGRADPTGTLHLLLHASSAEYPVPSSASIAPEVWHVFVSANYRQSTTSIKDWPGLPLQVGNCS
ncbi:hypothetical protein B7R21_11495 [Subtercola boreus]|uniref:Uncharacterized protein n=1 Tax=Subtercola boreus TaxID=120213 RepID=A0A3E0VSV1_9MICO|nr:hypothetical protein [Subtercola boreus]RFA11957.1 hypothetical protein B7R21_11495 [Subtercola boreus]